MEKSFIEVENREEIAAIHHEASSDKWMFFCHGYGSDKDGSYKERARKAAEMGFNSVRFDFRGNGESDGDFIDQSLSSRIRDLEACIEFFQPERVFLWGMSFGGKVILHANEGINVEALIFKSPVLFNDEMAEFESIVDNKGTYTHFGDKTVDKRFFRDFENYGFEDAVKEIDVPVIIFHGGNDETVEFESSADAVKDIDSEITLRKFRGETHFMSDKAEKVLLEEMFSWLERLQTL